MNKAVLILLIYIFIAFWALIALKAHWGHQYENGSNYINIMFSIEQMLYGIIPLLWLMRKRINHKNAIIYLCISFTITISAWLLFTNHTLFFTQYLCSLEGFLYVEIPHILGITGSVTFVKKWLS